MLENKGIQIKVGQCVKDLGGGSVEWVMEAQQTNTETATQSTILIEEVGDLYLRYRGQHSPQPCYVQLDCEAETLSAEVDGSIGPGTPMRVWHGRAIRWSIPALTESAAEGLLFDLIPLADEVIAGYSCEWDGSNHVGRLTEAAAEAAEAIRSLCDRNWSESEVLSVWDASDWYAQCGSGAYLAGELGVTAETTDAELDAIVEREEDQASPARIEGVERFLRDLREELRAETEEETEEG
jgi:hypothetical protein